MKLADLKLRIDWLVREHGESVLMEPVFIYGEDGWTIATELTVQIATHPCFAEACASANPPFENHQSKIGVFVS